MHVGMKRSFEELSAALASQVKREDAKLQKQAELQTQHDLRNDLQRRIDEVQMQIDLQQRNDDLQKQVDDLRRQNDLQSRNDELHQQNSELHRRNDELQRQNDELRRRNDDLESNRVRTGIALQAVTNSLHARRQEQVEVFRGERCAN